MSKFRHYKPRRWDPRFDLIIMDSIAGLDNQELAKKYGYTKEHISNILSTEEAGKVKERIRAAINKEFEGGVKDKIAGIGSKVIQRVEEFIENDDLAAKRPFDFVDRALRIGQAIGSLEGEYNKKGSQSQVGNTIVNGNVFVASKDQMDNLTNAITKSSSLEAIEPGIVKSIEDSSNDKKRLKVG